MTALALIKASAVTLIVAGILSLVAQPALLARRAIHRMDTGISQAFGLEAR